MPTPGNTTQRRYGWRDHAKPRQAIDRLVQSGKAICVRCGHAIPPGPWDYGHSDTDPTKHTGPEHVRCNRAAGARKGNRTRNTTKHPATTWHSKAWTPRG